MISYSSAPVRKSKATRKLTPNFFNSTPEETKQNDDSYSVSDSVPENPNLETGTNNPAVKRAIKLIQDNNYIKTQRDGKNRQVQRLFEAGFEVASPDGARKINSKLLAQAIWRICNKMKPLDFELFGSGTSNLKQQIVTDGMSTILHNGGLVSCLRDKGGVFQKSVLFGDSFYQIGANPEPNSKEVPLLFQVLSNSNVYFDVFATTMRNGGYGQKVTKMLVVRSMSYDSACKLFPKIKDIGGPGKIPRSDSSIQELERLKVQPAELQNNFTEIAYFYDLDNLCYTIFEGTQCTVLEEYKGLPSSKDHPVPPGMKPYPFVLSSTKEAYIPIFHNLCFPSSEGFYNHGIGEMLYDLAIITRRMMNMGAAHINDNTYPISLINLPKGTAADFFNRLDTAYQLRAQGYKGFVPVEYDPDKPQMASGSANAQSLLTPSLMNDWQVLYNKLEQEIRRLGINIDELDRPGNVSATQILQEEETSDSFVKQIMEYNASEYGFLIEVAIDMIKKLVKTNNDTPINSISTFRDPESGTDINVSEITLGAIADALRQGNWYIKVNSRSGAIPSNLMKQVKLMRVLQSVPPQSSAWNRLMVQFAQLNDTVLDESEIAPSAPPIPEGAEQEMPEMMGMDEQNEAAMALPQVLQ